MDIFLQVNIRKRRSQRLSHKSPPSPKKECLEPTELGDFSKMPLELTYNAFSYLEGWFLLSGHHCSDFFKCRLAAISM